MGATPANERRELSVRIGDAVIQVLIECHLHSDVLEQEIREAVADAVGEDDAAAPEVRAGVQS